MSLDNTMITKILLYQVFSTLILGVFSTELLPEKYLKPQDFNHHPFTDVGIPAALKKVLKSTNPYAILKKKKIREGAKFPSHDFVIYPTPQPSTIARKFLETNEVGYKNPYVHVPKNYAFSYIVKDQHSGDDFSHSQAHNGKATRGQYRVKLPDGRTQIVSYTADHKGYRADVQYEEELISKPVAKPEFHSIQSFSDTAVKIPTVLKSSNHNYQSGYIPDHISSLNSKSSSQVVYTVTASPIPTGGGQHVGENTQLNVVVNSKFTPHYQPQYVTPAALPYVQQHLVTTTAAPVYVPQHVPSTPLSPVGHASLNPTPSAYHQNQYQNYQAILSTSAPEAAVIVTPRPAYNRAITNNEQQAPFYYKLL